MPFTPEELARLKEYDTKVDVGEIKAGTSQQRRNRKSVELRKILIERMGRLAYNARRRGYEREYQKRLKLGLVKHRKRKT